LCGFLALARRLQRREDNMPTSRISAVAIALTIAFDLLAPPGRYPKTIRSGTHLRAAWVDLTRFAM